MNTFTLEGGPRSQQQHKQYSSKSVNKAQSQPVAHSDDDLLLLLLMPTRPFCPFCSVAGMLCCAVLQMTDRTSVPNIWIAGGYHSAEKKRKPPVPLTCFKLLLPDHTRQHDATLNVMHDGTGSLLAEYR